MREPPASVERYLRRALVSPRPAMRVRLTQEGEMRLKPDGRWLPFRATEELDARQVAFSWRARFRLAPLVSLRVDDAYAAGEGGLAARLWGKIPVMRSGGADVSRGEAMRYLAELMWVPHALRDNSELEWRAIDDRRAEVAVQVGGGRAAVCLEFDDAGDLVRTSAEDRPYAEGRSAVPRPWGGVMRDYQVLDGVRIPTRAEVSWTLPAGVFTYWRGTVTSLVQV